MGRWIAENKDTLNICYVVQTGDIVENGFEPLHWERFDLCYLQFRDIIPYFPIAGNHDIAVNHNDYAAYLERPFLKAFSPECMFENGKAVYATVYAGGLKFLLIGAGWDMEDAAVEWMNTVIAAHADHCVILLFHSYIQYNGKFSIPGKHMFEQVVIPNPNVRLVLCGHWNGFMGFRADEIDDTGDDVADRVVYAMMYNYQDALSWQAGQLRILEFDPLTHSLTVSTYSPYTGSYYVDYPHNAAVFTIEDAF